MGVAIFFSSCKNIPRTLKISERCSQHATVAPSCCRVQITLWVGSNHLAWFPLGTWAPISRNWQVLTGKVTTFWLCIGKSSDCGNSNHQLPVCRNMAGKHVCISLPPFFPSCGHYWSGLRLGHKIRQKQAKKLQSTVRYINIYCLFSRRNLISFSMTTLNTGPKKTTELNFMYFQSLFEEAR